MESFVWAKKHKSGIFLLELLCSTDISCGANCGKNKNNGIVCILPSATAQSELLPLHPELPYINV
jgi:hypothetical protein